MAADKFLSPKQAAEKAANDFYKGYIDQIAILLKKNWSPEITGKAKPSDEEFKTYARELVDKRQFTYKEDGKEGKQKTVKLSDLQALLTDEKKQELKNQYGSDQLEEVILTRDKVNKAAVSIGSAVGENRGQFSFLGGSTIGNAIMGLIEWIFSGFEGGFQGLFDTIAKRGVNNFNTDLKANLDKHASDINPKMREAIANQANQKAKEAAGLTPVVEGEKIENVVIGSANAQPANTPATPQKGTEIQITQLDANTQKQNQIDAALVSLSVVNLIGNEGIDRQKLLEELRGNDAIKFYDGNKYVSVSKDTTLEQFNSIIKKSEGRISVDVVNADGKKETKYYTQVAAQERTEASNKKDGKNTGFAGAVWRETDVAGKPKDKELIFTGAGWTGDLKDNSAQTHSLAVGATRKLNPQTADARKLMEEALTKNPDANSVRAVGHSYGGANAQAAVVVAIEANKQISGVHVIDPVMATRTRDQLAKQIDPQKKDQFIKTIDDPKITRTTRPVFQTKDGKLAKTFAPQLVPPADDKLAKAHEENQKDPKNGKGDKTVIMEGIVSSKFNPKAEEVAKNNGNGDIGRTDIVLVKPDTSEEKFNLKNKGDVAAHKIDEIFKAFQRPEKQKEVVEKEQPKNPPPSPAASVVVENPAPPSPAASNDNTIITGIVDATNVAFDAVEKHAKAIMPKLPKLLTPGGVAFIADFVPKDTPVQVDPDKNKQR